MNRTYEPVSFAHLPLLPIPDNLRRLNNQPYFLNMLKGRPDWSPYKLHDPVPPMVMGSG